MPGHGEVGPRVLRDWIAGAARRHPDKPCIVSADDGRAITHGELHRLTAQIAAFLDARGIRANDRVALLANNSIEHLACYFGVLAYGATICTIHVEMNRRHLDSILPALSPPMVGTMPSSCSPPAPAPDRRASYSPFASSYPTRVRWPTASALRLRTASMI